MAQLIAAGEVGESDGPLNVDSLRETESKYDSLVARVRKENKEQASLMNVEPLTLKQAQALLDPGQTLVEYFVGPEQTFIWVVRRNSFKGISVDVSQADLAKRVTAVRTAISGIAPVKEYQSLASDLYRMLIAPILPHTRGNELIVVPHGVLHYLPFQALYSPKRRYLIEDYTIAYMSSASLLQFVREKRKLQSDRVLAFGNPELTSDRENLRYAELEIAEVAKTFPRSAVFSKKDATESRFKTLARDYDIIHFATHSELDEENPLSSRILLTQSGFEDGKLEVREIFEMELKAGLVVLSACETALGKLSSGDELVGLTRAFIYAGTPSVMASLWKVDDASTADLMGSFYRNLKSKSKVESLRQAQLAMIHGKVGTNLLAQRGVGGVGKLGEAPARKSLTQESVARSHPYFWAPFILVGDGK
jgi:CHAT domain-containing protein